jgi:hypothetical protein
MDTSPNEIAPFHIDLGIGAPFLGTYLPVDGAQDA